MEHTGHIIAYLNRTTNIDGTFNYDGRIYYDEKYRINFYLENVPGDIFQLTGSIVECEGASWNSNYWWYRNYDVFDVFGIDLFDACYCYYKPTRMHGSYSV